jgi:hypothetical protein
MKYHIAQVNVAYAKGISSEAVMKGFNDRLDEINTLADKSPGFVWRYVTDSRDPLDRVFEDPLILYNLSVWTSIEALHHFTYKTVHAELYAGRKQWFGDWKALAGEMLGNQYFAMWWIKAGELPSVKESKEKMALISERGPTPLAFNFKNRFPPPEM